LTAEFVSDRVSYIVLRGGWGNIIVLNVHAPSEVRSDDSKDSCYEEILMKKWGERIFPNRQLGMTVYIR